MHKVSIVLNKIDDSIPLDSLSDGDSFPGTNNCMEQQTNTKQSNKSNA